MIKRQIFYSFHYENDVFRVHQIRNIGALDDNKPVSPNDWETIKRAGDNAIKKWIDDNMNYRSCVVVLIGEQTSDRKWVKYEITKAYSEGKALLGIYIHNLQDPRTGKCNMGKNPFAQFPFGTKILCKNPSANNAYNDIRNNLELWIEEAIQQNKNLI